ncbi:dinitrogenase reductase activating glycohydrolase [Geminocystis sp. NIES-3708]|uniref:ADP-ribosylglycohydrolase family protein n=1 Tax=Geminocystis sp. NIES-3708 TaxID=1615909 RepID=UPI0005FC5219|nr:ADP-ribosylglycohydrolase family protein [Geminocystis sp. NIES-3708]BAQ60862.1 dinitrogenase reductase activating glycohydrolase [Geminocystis sp. NIES-3708]
MNQLERIRGLLIGTAVGDSVGLPAEGISRRRNKQLFREKWHQGLIFGYGMISDDTEHTIFISQCLLACGDSEEVFLKRFSWCLKLWLLSLPAGVGLGTLKSIIKLWLGFSPYNSGVYSAGNGAAMRSSVLGAYFADNLPKLDIFIRLSTRITHSDPRALIGAKAIAYIIAWIVREDLKQCPDIDELELILRLVEDKEAEWLNLTDQLIYSLKQSSSVAEFAQLIGQEKGISGYVYKTVPIAIYAWYSHFDNFRDALESVFNCGGDTDTTGAITGALCGVTMGESAIPKQWQKKILDFPRNTRLLIKIADRLTENINNNYQKNTPVSYGWWWILPRNLLFLIIVLMHGFRRLLPPF